MGLLDGKVAIVTGSGRGVGKAEVLYLAREGAKVVVNDLGGSVDGTGAETMVADEVVKEIKEAGGEAAANYSDISTVEGVDTLIWTALTRFGRLDVMVNNAGILRDKTLLNMGEDDWDLVQKVHSKGSFLCTRAAGRVMKTQGQGGVIINTTSMSGLIGNFGQSNYGHAKSGIYGFTKVAAMELGRYGIRVHAVCPNAYTRMTSSLPGMKNITEDMISPEAMAPLVTYLASDLSKGITGRVLAINGGSIGTKTWEFKMTMAGGFVKKEGIPNVDEIARNIDKVLCSEEDLDMMAAMKMD